VARILVVEDEALVAVTICDALQERGHEVIHAINGGAALAALELQLPDLIVTDYRMPRLNGAELIDALRGDPRWANIPVLMVSAYAAPDTSAQSLGIAEFIQKPFTDKTLIAAVERLLTRSAVPV
jgi:CheY-like chemotaxis protein